MDSIIFGTIIGVLFIIQGVLNIRFNRTIVTTQDRVDTLEQLHWARTNPVHVVEVEDPECANPSNI
jgi:hypothetical protein